jgi:hypothetical protein
MSIRLRRPIHAIPTALALLAATFLAPSVALAFNDFSISASPNSITLGQGGSEPASTISTATTSGVVQGIALSVSGLPSGASGGCSPSSVTSGQSSTLTLNAGTAAAGTYVLTITGAAASGSHSTTFSLTITDATPDRPQTWGSLKAHYR